MELTKAIHILLGNFPESGIFRGFELYDKFVFTIYPMEYDPDAIYLDCVFSVDKTDEVISLYRPTADVVKNLLDNEVTIPAQYKAKPKE